jgi:hypothetical protein
MERLEARITKSRAEVRLLVGENVTSNTETIDEVQSYAIDLKIWEIIKERVEEDANLQDFSFPVTKYPYAVKRLTVLFIALRYPNIGLNKDDDVRDKKTFCEYVIKKWTQLTMEQIQALYSLANEHTGSIEWRTAIQNAMCGIF